jgi:hypothetical protein
VPLEEEKRPKKQESLLDDRSALDDAAIAEIGIADQEEEEGQSVEERPPPTPTKEEVASSPRIGYWAQMTDESGTVYYYHTITGETSWEPPVELTEGDEVVEPHHDQDMEGNGEQAMRNGDWIQLQDDGGNFYWYNEVTGQSSWELPVDDPELYALPDPVPVSVVADQAGGAYASASAGGYTIEL